MNVCCVCIYIYIYTHEINYRIFFPVLGFGCFLTLVFLSFIHSFSFCLLLVIFMYKDL